MSYDQNMNQSSVWWGTVYADKNLDAVEKEFENEHKPGKHESIPAVAWWEIGNDVWALCTNFFKMYLIIENFPRLWPQLNTQEGS